jgi:hypothetical protein
LRAQELLIRARRLRQQATEKEDRDIAVAKAAMIREEKGVKRKAEAKEPPAKKLKTKAQGPGLAVLTATTNH